MRILLIGVLAVLLIALLGCSGDDIGLQTTVFDDPMDTLRHLATTHPDEEIRKELSQLIASEENEVFFLFNLPLNGRTLAAFGLIPEEFIEQREIVKGRTLVPVFVFPVAFIQGRDPDLAKQTVITHEWEHYRSWIEGRYPELIHVVTTNLDTPEIIEMVYEEEVYAMTQGCEFAIKMGIGDRISRCTILKNQGVLALRQNLARGMEHEVPEEFHPFLATLANK